MAARFTMTFTTVGSAAGRATALPAWRVQQLLDEHHPREMVDNMALIIMHQTYHALLEILGPEAPRSGDGHVQVTSPVDPADPASPLLSVNASTTHCCIRMIIDGLHDSYAASPEQWGRPQRYRLPRATVTASPGTLHLARRDVAAGAGPRGDHWTCADVRPDFSNNGLLGVLDAIRARVDAAIQVGLSLLRMAWDSGCQPSPKLREIAEVGVALEKMRAAVNLDAIMPRRWRCQMRGRRPLIQEEVACRPDVVDRACDDDAEALAKRLCALHVGQKRGRRVHEISCRHADDAAEVLAKRLRTLHV
ncbi:hypothetical protein C2845_PM01G20370 [Panicum miliaceum]|uniref:Uncharacterized protein n=1 Tax=Panicum miliaceum TaxID=4540 RepID=A0A3L6TR60_PANMI|nr:hypothetical protein C2845_PM01G20370 [Panicum miliaceum]